MTVKTDRTRKPRSIWQRCRRVAAVVCGVGLLILVALYLSRYVWLEPLLKRRVIEAARDQFGVELAVDRIQGNYWRDITMTNVVLSGVPGQSHRCRQLTIHWAPWLLRQGAEVMIRDMGITAEGYDGTIDTTVGTAGSSEPVNLPALLPAISVHNSHLELEGDTWAVQVDQLNGTLLSVGSGLHLRVTAEAGGHYGNTKIGAQLLTASLEHLGGSIAGDVTFGPQEQRLLAATLQLTLEPQTWMYRFQLQGRILESPVQVSASQSDDSIELAIAFQQLEIERLEPYLPANDINAHGTVSGDMVAAIDRRQWTLSRASGRAHGETLSGAGWNADRADVDAEIDHGVVTVHSATIVGGRDTVTVTNAMLSNDLKFAAGKGGTSFAITLSRGGGLAAQIEHAYPQIATPLLPEELQVSGTIDTGGAIHIMGRAASAFATLEDLELYGEYCDNFAVWPPCDINGSFRLHVADLQDLATATEYSGPTLTGALDADLIFGWEHNTREPSLLDAAIVLAHGRVGEYVVDSARLAGALENGQVRIDDVAVQSGDLTFAIRDGITALGPWLAGEVGAALQETTATVQIAALHPDPAILGPIAGQLPDCLLGILSQSELSTTAALNKGTVSGTLTLRHGENLPLIVPFTTMLDAGTGLPDQIDFAAERIDVHGLLSMIRECYDISMLPGLSGTAMIRGTAALPLGPRALADCPLSLRVELDFTVTTVVGSGTVQPPGSIVGSILADGTFGHPTGTAELKIHNLPIQGTMLRNGTVRLKTDTTTMDIAEFAFDSDDMTVVGRGRIDLLTGNLLLGVSAVVADIGAYLQGVPGNPSGLLAADAEITGVWSHPEINAAASATALSWYDRQLPELAAVLCIRLPSPGEEGIPAIECTSLMIGSGAGALASTAPAILTVSRAGTVTVDRLQMAGPGGSLSLRGGIGDTGELDLTLDSVLSEALVDGLLPGSAGWDALQLDVVVCGLKSDPEIRMKGDIQGGRLPSGTVVDSIRFDLARSGEGLRVNSLDVVDDQMHLKADGMVPWDPLTQSAIGNQIVATADLEVADLAALDAWLPAPWQSRGRLRVHGEIAGPLASAAGKLHIDAAGVTLPQQALGKEIPPADLTADVHFVDGGRMTIDHFDLKAQEQLQIALTGTWLRPGFLVDLLHWQHGINPGVVDLHLVAGGKPPETLFDASRIGVPAAGRMEMDVTIKGKLPRPDWQGSVLLRDTTVRLADTLPTIRNLGLTAQFDGQVLHLNSISGELGAEPFSGEGTIVLASDELLTELHLSGKNLLIHRAEGIKLRADCDLKVSGSLNQLSISGELVVVDGRYERNLNFLELLGQVGMSRQAATKQSVLFSITESPLREAKLDLGVRADPAIRIRTNMVKGAIRPDLRLSGTGEVPVLIGTVAIEPTVVSLVSGRLNIVRGQVSYTEENPNRAMLYVEGNARLLGYAITVLIDGPLDEPVVTLTSSPPLPTEDILILLLTGKPPEVGDSLASSRANRRVTLYVAQGLLQNWLGPQGDGGVGALAERLELDVGNDITRSGQDAVSMQFHLTDNVLGGTNSLVITAERDVYDAYNAGIRLIIRGR